MIHIEFKNYFNKYFCPRWYVCTTRVHVLLLLFFLRTHYSDTAYFIEFHHAIIARALLPRQVQTWQNFAEFHQSKLSFALFLFSEYCIFDQFHILHQLQCKQPCPAALSVSLARQPCLAALPGSLAR
jgi:hypothetical protein